MKTPVNFRIEKTIPAVQYRPTMLEITDIKILTIAIPSRPSRAEATLKTKIGKKDTVLKYLNENLK